MPLRLLHCVPGAGVAELAALPAALPDAGFLWIGCSREAFEQRGPELQEVLARWGCGTLVDLHVSDLLNAQLPSHFDYTSWYDLMVFRRLAAGTRTDAEADAGLALGAIDTRPVGLAVFDRVLLSVHPADCGVREHFAQRLSGAGARLPTSPADLMLRIVNHLVDGYLDLRRLATRQLGALQQALLDPKSRFGDWSQLLAARNALHLLEDTCEDQRSAVQEWIDALDEWPPPADAAAARERELLRIRSRDVIEHVERVLVHVRRLEASAETAVQMHFSAMAHRTSDIMRTLTVLTAVFLPLNLITGFFGMNFDWLPLVHDHSGVWIAVALMIAIGVGLLLWFRRKRYLGRTR